MAFSIVNYAGALYLIGLGLRKILGRGELPNAGATSPPRARSRVFRDGFIVNLLNPKTALFFFSFLPQFVDAHRGHVATQIAVPGLLFTALGILTDTSYTMAAGTIGA